MGRTAINVAAIMDATNNIKSAKTSVGSAKSAFTQTKNAIDGKIQNRNNIRARLTTVQNQLSRIDSQLGKISATVQNAAGQYKSTDAKVDAWGNDLKGALNPPKPAGYVSEWESQFIGGTCPIEKPEEKPKPQEVNLKKYDKKASDAEYALLCDILYDALKAKDPSAKFVELLNKKLPENDPLKNIDPSQVRVVRSASGFETVIIDDGDTAIVVFAGTDTSSVGDIIADVQLATGNFSVQEIEALGIVKALSKDHDNIVVAGHSLGGYLATAVTLRNDKVSKCVAFDAPGRYDTLLQTIFNKDQVEKITNYEANGSPISDGLSVVSGWNQNPGEVNNLHVDGDGNFLRHSIAKLYQAMGGDQAVAKPWAKT